MNEPDNYLRPVYLPMGISDIHGTIGCISNLTNGIDAIDLLSGNIIWKTSAASKPLLIYNNRLAALQLDSSRMNTFRIAVFDLDKKGLLIMYSEPVVLPEWVSIKQNDTFEIEGKLAENTLIFDFSASIIYQGGAAPSDEIQNKHSTYESGTILLNLESGIVEIRPSSDVNRSQSEELIAQQLSGLPVVQMWKRPENIVALLFEVDGNKVAFYLKFWNLFSNMPSKEIKLLEGEAMVPYVTADKLYIFFHEETYLKDKSLWHVFSAETGQLIGKLTYEQNAQQPCIINSNVYYIIEKQHNSLIDCVFKARELATDKIKWEVLLYQRTVVKRPPLRL